MLFAKYYHTGEACPQADLGGLIHKHKYNLYLWEIYKLMSAVLLTRFLNFINIFFFSYRY